MPRLTRLSRSVAGRAVIVTGAASGMGRATAHLFADEGAMVAVTDIDPDGVAAVTKEIVDAGLTARGWVLDMADGTAIRQVVAAVAEAFGRLDIVINNAGFAAHAAIDDPEFEAVWERAHNAMLTGQMRMVRAALPHLRKSDAARIVNVASTEALGATPAIAPYTSAKHAVVGLTRSLAVDLGREGITVNCICPGAVRTGITQAIPEEHKAKFVRRRVPLVRYAEPEEVAQMTFNCCLPAMSYLNGAVIPVDGGLTIKNA
ncbi:MAG: SDR family oxidoreductase [Sneathiellaceae bacterium]